MPSKHFTESDVENAALEWLQGLGYTLLHEPAIAPGETPQGVASGANLIY